MANAQPTENEVRRELENILCSNEANDLYDQLPETNRGKIFNTDLARELSPHYRTFDDRVAFTMATFRPAADYVFRRTIETIHNDRGQIRRILILAGGPASGKTFSVQNVPAGAFDMFGLVYDTTFSDLAKSDELLRTVRQSGWEAVVRFIYRPYGLAVESMLERALVLGRYVCLGHPSRLADVHYRAQKTFIKMSQKYAGIAGISFDAIANCGSRVTPQPPFMLDIKELDENGRYCYNSVEELYGIQEPIFEDFSKTHPEQQALIHAIQQRFQ